MQSDIVASSPEIIQAAIKVLGALFCDPSALRCDALFMVSIRTHAIFVQVLASFGTSASGE